MTSLQSSVLPEAAEILQILQRIELEGLFFTHDKLAERQVSCGWRNEEGREREQIELGLTAVRPFCSLKAINVEGISVRLSQVW